jgi:hypothetical protein
MWRPIAHDAFGAEAGEVADTAAAAIAPLGNLWLVRRRLPLLSARERGKDAAYRDLLRPLFHAIAKHTGAGTIVDASKLPWHAAAVAGLDDFNVTVLHVVRDPRGVAFSHLKRIRYDTDEHRSLYMDRHGVVESSLAWVYRNRLTEWVWQRRPNYVRIRHEDFVARPAEVLAGILKRAGTDGKLPEFTGSQQVVIQPTHNVSGNPVRFQHGPVTLKADEAWRSELPSRTAHLVGALTWPHRKHYGYD